jgi:hypothetical protein
MAELQAHKLKLTEADQWILRVREVEAGTSGRRQKNVWT